MTASGGRRLRVHPSALPTALLPQQRQRKVLVHLGPGRRSQTGLRWPGADISRVPAEISTENGGGVIRDKQSRFGTFINGEKHSEKVLAHGDQIRFGQAGDTEIVFFVDEEAPSVERSAI